MSIGAIAYWLENTQSYSLSQNMPDRDRTLTTPFSPLTERYASNRDNQQALSKHEKTTDKTDRSSLAKFDST